MTDRHHPDDLAQLRAELVSLRAEVRRKRFPRRFLPLALVGLLVALLPLSILAAGPVFGDLDTAAPVHRPHIQAIADAGITTGFADPNDPTKRLYNPKDLVTREEMASFLARTAGLSDIPPLVLAKTAQTADNATRLGGQLPSAYLPSSGEMTLRSTFYGAEPDPVAGVALDLNRTSGPTVRVTAAVAGSGLVRVPVDRPASMFGVNLAVKAVTLCYRVQAGAAITGATLYYGANGAPTLTPIVTDPADQTSTTNTCFTLTPETTAAYNGPLYLYLTLSFGASTQAINLNSILLTLTPTAAAELAIPGAPGNDGDVEP